MKTLFCRWRLAVSLSFFVWLPGSLCAQTIYQNVILAEPTDGAVYFSPGLIEFLAHVADDPDNGVIVQFYANSNLIAEVTNGVATVPSGRNFSFEWTNAPVGAYAVAAKAIRANQSLSMWSATNNIIVHAGYDISVNILEPTNGAVYASPTNIDLLAGGLDTNGTVKFVRFVDTSSLIGTVTAGEILDPGPSGFPPGWVTGDRAYILSWTNQTIGTHTLTAELLDEDGQLVTSPPVTIVIGSNIPPRVAMTTPANHAVFDAPVNIPLVAYASSPDGSIASVEFFSGTNSLGFATPFPTPIVGPLGTGVSPIISPPLLHYYSYIWTNPTIGSFELTAVATDGFGGASTSAPVAISVQPSVTPPTNFPDVVSVFAADPIAIASTNCWTWRGLTNGAATWSQWEAPTAIWRIFTNCGPKDATFTVRRLGAETNDLTVNYTLSGSATNGIDYEDLGASVTIPAGQETAAISIVPMQNGSNYVRTVVLVLDPSTNSPAGYEVGYLSKAAALIIDNEPVGFPQETLLGGVFHFTLSGPDGAWFHIDYTTNLESWTPLCTNQVVDGAIDFIDPNATGSPTRLYRAVPLNNAPSN